MKTDLPSAKDIRSLLRKELPADYYKATPSLLVMPSIYAVSIFAICSVLTPATPWYLIAASILWIGHALFCIATFSHNLSHNSVVKNNRLRYLLENVFWPLVFFTPTVWRVTHNRSHHSNTNQEEDCFRHFTPEEIESKWARKLVYKMLSPKRAWKYTPTVYLTYFVFQLTYMFSAILQTHGYRSNIVAYLPKYTKKEYLANYFELLVMLGIHSFILYLMEWNIGLYLLVIGTGITITGAFASAYLFTQHNVYGVQKDNHPLKSTTSVGVPGLVDWSHQWLSHHVEHHVLPGMSAKYYPEVGRFLNENYPAFYDKRPMLEVIGSSYDKRYVFEQDFESAPDLAVVKS